MILLTANHHRLLRQVATFALLLACLWLPGCSGDADEEPAPGTFDLRLVPADASAILGMQVAKVVGQKEMESFAVILQETVYRKQQLNFQDFQQVLMVTPPSKEKLRPNRGAVIFTLKEGAATDAASLLKELTRGQSTQPSKHKGQSLQLTRHNAFCRLDDRTVVIGTEDDVKWLLDAQNQEGQEPAWLAKARSLADMDGLFAVDTSQVAEQMSNMPAGAARSLQMFAPFWQETVSVVGGVSLTGNLSYRVIVNCRDEEGAKKVLDTANSLVLLGRNMMDGFKTQLEKVPSQNEEDVKMQSTMLGMADDLLTNLKVKQNGTEVTVSTSTNTDVAKTLVAALMPAVMQAREAARRSQSKNNLKQIGIALHNYHEAHRRFPGPTNLGPDGKTVHSWRVAILPFLDEQALYDRYKLNEPWDSENNKKVLAQMPDVFRNLNSTGDPTHTCYLGFSGPNTVLGDGSKGIRFRDVMDGESNTVLVSEAQREIPWTKPEDIPCDKDTTDLNLGGFHKGGFNALLTDGSVRFISEQLDKSKLRFLIIRNDQERVSF